MKIAPDIEDALCTEYKAWTEAQGLPRYSADELMCEDVTQEQRAWLADFIKRWDASLREDTMKQTIIEELTLFARAPRWELQAVKKALSMHPWLNSPQERARLEAVKHLLRQRKTP